MSGRTPEMIAKSTEMMLALYNDGWYKSGTGTTIYEVALKLARYGVSEDDVHDCISEIISAIKDEYGD